MEQCRLVERTLVEQPSFDGRESFRYLREYLPGLFL